jgi:NAD+ synthase
LTLSIALIQGGFFVGNIAANVARITAFYRMATIAKADLVVFPEMAITGYPPEDLVFQESFQQRSSEALERCAKLTADGPAILIGGLSREGQLLFNTVFLLDRSQVVARQAKRHLPNYGVFDEQRYFHPGPLPEPLAWRDTRLGVMICEDMWHPQVALNLKKRGAEILICINASPYEIEKPAARETMAAARVAETGLALCYLNQVAGQDDLVFDGSSFVMNERAQVCARLDSFREDFVVTAFEQQGRRLAPVPCLQQETKPRCENEMIYRALVLALRDFIAKNGFAGIVLGLSGGIDSALAAALAVEAVGKSSVRAVMLPSPFTPQDSIDDAEDCARRLGIRFETIAIGSAMDAFSATMHDVFGGHMPDVAVGDFQPRLRGCVLMALSRKENLLLLNTGNKSEMATGYTTIYGDMCGHFAVLKDIYKTTVYALADWRNRQGSVIPLRTISKAPSAELLPGQTDQDTLPPYAILDQVLFQMIEQRRDIHQIVEQGFERTMVEEVSGMVHRAEFKRRQSAPGPKISTMAFSRERRYPISDGWYVEQHGKLISGRPPGKNTER